MAAFTVWVTGPDMHDVEAIAHQVDGRLRAHGVRTELLDVRTPHIDALNGEDGLVLLSSVLARHDVTAIIALPIGSRAKRDRARDSMERVVEVYVPRPGCSALGYEPPDRPDVEVGCPDKGSGTGAARVMTLLEHLGYIGADARATSAEERAVRKRLKDFGYL
jgi:hypothetical protein